MKTKNKTYDIVFDDCANSSNKGFKETLKFCKTYVKIGDERASSYFHIYKGGTVSIICNETGETVFSKTLK